MFKRIRFHTEKNAKIYKGWQKNIVGTVIYLLGDDPSKNINNYLEEINKEKIRREKEMKEFDEEIIIKEKKERKE